MTRKQNERGWGWIYFIRSGETDFYKIGLTTKHPMHRLKEHQTGNQNELELVGSFESNDIRATEKYYHDRFKHYHVRGEWFEIPWHVLQPLFPDYFSKYTTEHNTTHVNQTHPLSYLAWLAWSVMMICICYFFILYGAETKIRTVPDKVDETQYLRINMKILNELHFVESVKNEGLRIEVECTSGKLAYVNSNLPLTEAMMGHVIESCTGIKSISQ